MRKDGPDRVADDSAAEIIGRLFSAGLDLRLVLGVIDRPATALRLRRAIATVDAAIADVQAVALRGSAPFVGRVP